MTRYAVDLAAARDGAAATLFLDSIGIPGFEYSSNVIVLDRMARSVRVPRHGAGGGSVVARYAGGGGGFTVEAAERGPQRCLRIAPGGAGACADRPERAEVVTITLTDVMPVLAGLAGRDVFSVTAVRTGAGTSTVLPAPVRRFDASAFAFTFPPGTVDRIEFHDIRGAPLGSLQP